MRQERGLAQIQICFCLVHNALNICTPDVQVFGFHTLVREVSRTQALINRMFSMRVSL